MSLISYVCGIKKTIQHTRHKYNETFLHARILLLVSACLIQFFFSSSVLTYSGKFCSGIASECSELLCVDVSTVDIELN